MRSIPGFSLLELLVTLGLITLIVTSGVPAFNRTIHAARLNAEVNTLIRAVHIARSEAVKRNGEAVICPSHDGLSCVQDAGAWTSGWLVFANQHKESPPEINNSDSILVFHQVHPAIRITANRRWFVFHNYAKRSTNGTVIFCPTASKILPRAVVISYTGRPRSARRRSDGRPFLCND